MKRQIKFRAWDATDKCFYYLDRFWNDHWYTTPNNGGVAGPQNNNLDVGRRAAYRDNFVLEQFTGRLDSKRVEIYEGDIIIMNPMDDEGYGEVVWKSKFARFEFVRYNHIDQTDACDISFICSITEFGKGENGSYVIGNIHQNPELLEDAPTKS